MKWTLLVILMVFATGKTVGQDYLKDNSYTVESPINIALDEVKKRYVAPPARLKSAEASATFKVSYVNFPEEAKQAFEYAVSIWEGLISSTVPINVEARWESLSGNTLAKGRPSVFYHNFNGAPVSNVYFPVALAEKVTGKEMNPGSPDIVCTFNSNFQWYFGADGNTPETHYDFVSSVLHEITHGLGFSGFFNDQDGSGFYNNPGNIPSIYDHYVFNAANQQISDKSLFHSPSVELHNQLTSEKLKIYSPDDGESQVDNTIEWVFAPAKWNPGSSIYHLDGYTYGEDNSLMSPFARKGEAIHDPGEKSIDILAEIGWKSVSFIFDEFKDMEESVAELPVNIDIVSELDSEISSLKLYFSTNSFEDIQTVNLQLNSLGEYSGKMPLDHFEGKVQYYFEAVNTENRSFKFPAGAPDKNLTLRIGPDYYTPELLHNPVKLVSTSDQTLELNAVATDNVGIDNVKIEYKINGVQQEPFVLDNETGDFYNGKLQLPGKLQKDDRVEYRIIAEDKSDRVNKKSLPSMGFYKVNLFSNEEAISGYHTDFEQDLEDFILADFDISAPSGFSGNVLHSNRPYPESNLENEKYNLVAQLKYPIIIQEGGEMSFDEVVLVEPGEMGYTFEEQFFWDYVIVEASTDRGDTWMPLTDGYDAGDDDTWYSTFKNNYTNNTSVGKGDENMFLKHTIGLTDDTGLAAGDTAIIRFRLASDNSINGWGWAIDNLEIQTLQTSTDDLVAETQSDVNVYPNPFSNSFFVEHAESANDSQVEIKVTNLTGKTILHETGIDPFFEPKTRIDLEGSSPGIYIVSVSNGNGNVTTNKIIKN